MISLRSETITAITTLLNGVTSFDGVLVWDDLPSEYSQSAIYIKDTKETYEKKNSKYLATLRVEIIAICIETENNSAAELGNIALDQLITAVEQFSVKGVAVNLVDSFKWVQTKGKTACEIELNIDLKYQF